MSTTRLQLGTFVLNLLSSATGTGPRINFRKRVGLVGVAAALCAPCFLHAQQGEGGMIRPSGLRPAFPAKVRCPEIASPFGARTRYDGSPRPSWSFGGYHGGIDISLPEGTPLLALAGGTVASTGEGGMLEGIYLWLRHSPEETGLTYWVYSKYQHLQSAPDLAIGTRVAAGQVVAHSGRTGTVGKHYGASGYPHLHLTTRKSSSGDVVVGTRGTGQGADLIDPLTIYHETSVKPGQSAETPSERAASIPYATADGQLHPQGTKVVWPVFCR